VASSAEGEIFETKMSRISCDRSPTTPPVQTDVHRLPIRHSTTSATENETNYSIILLHVYEI